jgi:hypothetical protein
MLQTLRRMEEPLEALAEAKALPEALVEAKALVEAVPESVVETVPTATRPDFEDVPFGANSG